MQVKHSLVIYLFVIGVFSITFTSSTLVALLHAFYRFTSANRDHKLTKQHYATLGSVSFYVISCIIFMFIVFLLDPESDSNFEDNEYFALCMVLWVSSVFLARLSLYIQYMTRMYIAFEGSALSMNTATIVITIVLLCLSVICIIWWIILIVIRHIIRKESFTGYYPQMYCIITLLIVCDLSISWSVVVLFIRKLYKVLLFKCRAEFIKRAENKLIVEEDGDTLTAELPRMDTLTKTRSLVMDIIGAAIDASDHKTLDLITKQCILSSLSIMMTQFVYVTLFIMLLIKDSEWFHENYVAVYWLFAGVYYPMDLVINCIVMYFNYKFAWRYYTFCCKHCHQRCKLCVVRRAVAEIHDKYYEKEEHLKDGVA